MANSLGIDLTKKVVVLKGVAMVKDRLFFCMEGFGCYNYTAGSKVIGRLLTDGRETSVDGNGVERLATPEEIKSVNQKYLRD